MATYNLKQILNNTVIKYLFSLLIISFCLVAGHLISSVLPLTFPRSILGLIVLFLMLEFKVIKLDWVMPVAAPLLKHLAFLFLPVAVGVVTYLDQVYSSLFLIILNCFLGIALIIVVVGRVFQHYIETPTEREKRHTLYKRAKNIKRYKKLAKKEAKLNYHKKSK